MDLTVETHTGSNGFWSQVREYPGCFASGRTLSELHEALGEAVGLYLWDVPARIAEGELGVGESRIRVADPR